MKKRSTHERLMILPSGLITRDYMTEYPEVFDGIQNASNSDVYDEDVIWPGTIKSRWSGGPINFLLASLWPEIQVANKSIRSHFSSNGLGRIIDCLIIDFTRLEFSNRCLR